MIRVFCDRCDRDVTGKPHGSISGIEDVTDLNASGTVTDDHDALCQDCYAAFRIFMTALHEWDKRAKRIRSDDERSAHDAVKADRSRRRGRRLPATKGRSA